MPEQGLHHLRPRRRLDHLHAEHPGRHHPGHPAQMPQPHLGQIGRLRRRRAGHLPALVAHPLGPDPHPALHHLLERRDAPAPIEQGRQAGHGRIAPDRRQALPLAQPLEHLVSHRLVEGADRPPLTGRPPTRPPRRQQRLREVRLGLRPLRHRLRRRHPPAPGDLVQQLAPRQPPAQLHSQLWGVPRIGPPRLALATAAPMRRRRLRTRILSHRKSLVMCGIAREPRPAFRPRARRSTLTERSQIPKGMSRTKQEQLGITSCRARPGSPTSPPRAAAPTPPRRLRARTAPTAAPDPSPRRPDWRRRPRWP